MARPKTKTNAQVRNDYAKKTYDRISYQVRKDATNSKPVLQAVADALHAGSVTKLIDAAVSQYLDGIKNPAVIAAMESARAAQAEDQSGGND